MNNFPIEHEGKTYWISRAVAVTGFIFKKIDGKWHILINQRGEGTPDFQLHWNVPCGYLDFNESHQEATSRELYEETGFKVDPKKWFFWEYNLTQKQINKMLQYILIILQRKMKIIQVSKQVVKLMRLLILNG